MGFYEDERIRNKNKPQTEAPKEEQKPLRLEIGNNCSLADVLETLREGKFKVSLRGKNTVVIE